MLAPLSGPPGRADPPSPALEAAFDVVGAIRARGRLAVVAGGAVRDTVLGRPIADADIATDMPLEELSSLFAVHEIGRSKQFETVVVCRNGQALEVSRFRSGPGASRPQGAVDPLVEDTAHRDFTINALLMGPDRRVIDLQGGLDDLRDRVIRAVGSPEERFAEDPVRILRAVRFAACLDFSIEARTAAALSGCAPRLAAVAGERIGKEVLAMASQPGGALAAGLELLERFGLLRTVLPEVADLQGLEQPAEWHPEGDAWHHTLAALRSSVSGEPAVNLSVMLHDIGKRPAHREEDGRHRYHGHERAGAGLVETVARRLFLPQRMRAAIAYAVEHHIQAARMSELRRSKRLALIAGEHWPILRALALCDIGARGDRAATLRAEAVFAEAERDAAPGGRRVDAPAISGSRIMELTGLAPGPRVGEIQRRVTEWALDNRIEDGSLIEAQALRLLHSPPA